MLLALASWLLSGPAVRADAFPPVDRVNAALNQVEKGIAQGPFQATWESLEKYRVPQWYLDAKFGIFIHWGVYSVPAFGNEWYPRNMYKRDEEAFRHHAQTYGSQATAGYKDFIPRFTADKFDAARWAELFRRAGARYVVPVAEHHDGFPMYDCSFTEWSAARMGPKRDILAELSRAVRKQGLHFCASTHRAEHWWFYDQGMKFDSDVRDPRYAGLYGPARPENTQPNMAYLDDWLVRTCEIVDKYKPELIWFDWWIEQPVFKPYLQRFAAFYYNRGEQWNRGVAINYKNQAFPAKTAVLDIERGQLARIRPIFWQTDTAVAKNSWGYVANQDYKTVDSIVDDLIDIVSKNGALLLNIGPRPDGTIPEPEEQILLGIGQWLGVNGEALYGTRPWRLFGEGPTQVVGGSFNDTKRQAFTGQDIRFTTKDGALYALCLDWPGAQVTIRTLALAPKGPSGKITSVTLLGYPGKLSWTQDAEGLTVVLPNERPCEHAYALRIQGLNLVSFQVDSIIRPGSDGTLLLNADAAELNGSKLGVESRGGQSSIGFWDDPQEWVSWQVQFAQPGVYEAAARYAAAKGDAQVVIEAGGPSLEATLSKTASWDDFQYIGLGRLEVSRPGRGVVKVRPLNARSWKPANVSFLTLRKAE